MPAVVEDQVGGVALDPIAGTDLGAQLLRHAEDGEEEEQDPIFVGLGVTLEADVADPGQRSPVINQPAKVHLQVDLSGGVRRSGDAMHGVQVPFRPQATPWVLPAAMWQ